MKCILSILFLMLSAIATYGQHINTYKWVPVKIPIDSLHSLELRVIDSLHLYYIAYKTNVYIDTLNNRVNDLHKYYFESSDGGKTWDMRGDTINKLFLGYKTPDSYRMIHEGKNTRYLLYNNTPFDELYRSDDAGISWNKLWSQKREWQLLTALTKNDPILYPHDSGHLYRSTDGGVTFPYKITNDAFFKMMRPDTVFSSPYRDAFAEIGSYIKKETFYHTLVIKRPWDRDNDTNVFYNTHFPQGLHTLVSTSGGASWKSYVTPIPNQPLGLGPVGHLQYSYDNQRLFYIFGIPFERELGGSFNGWRGELGLNYGYSDDDGRTWKFDSTFYLQRHAIEPIGKEEIWMTLTTDKILNMSHHYPGYIITRTTDMGKSWEFDSTTLGDLYEQEADGHIITFSDPRHGWIAATSGSNTYILRYDANEQLKFVEKGETQTYHYMWLYPMPAKEEVHINFIKKGTIQDVEFFDIMGRKIPVLFTMNDNTATARVNDIPSGYYMVRAKLSGQYYARPLIVGK